MGAKGRCSRCKGIRFKPIEEIENHEVAGTTYRVVVSGRKCANCDEVYLEGPEVARAELQVAAEVARRGPASAETFRFMRRVLGLKSGELGELLGVSAETMSRWEQGHRDLDRAAWATLGAIATEAFEGRTTTRDRLETLRKPGRQPKTVRLDPADT